MADSQYSCGRRVNNVCGGVPSFHQNLFRHQVSCLLALQLVSYASSKKEHGQNENLCLPMCCFGILVLFRFHKFGKRTESERRTEFPNVWGRYKYHGNPYILLYLVIRLCFLRMGSRVGS